MEAGRLAEAEIACSDTMKRMKRILTLEIDRANGALEKNEKCGDFIEPF